MKLRLTSTLLLLATLHVPVPCLLAADPEQRESSEHSAATTIDHKITERRYCTQFGPFLIRFDREKAAGIYAIVPNGHLGTVVGTLDGDRIEARWNEVSSAGDIEIVGRDSWNSFVARYRTDAEPERWYEDWGGVEQPADRPPSFERNGTRYLCERPPGAP